MKWIITSIVLAFSAISFSQLAPPRQVVKLNLPKPSTSNNTPIVGPALLIGGASFIAAGLLAQPVMEGGSTTEKKAPIHQLHRILPIVSGSAVFVVGIGFTLGGR
jgi:hypothetical protein